MIATPHSASAQNTGPHRAMPRTVEFEQITDDSYGGKAAGLAELQRLGLDVPPGFVIADAAADLVVVDTTRWFTRMAAAGATPVAVRSSQAAPMSDDPT